MAQPSHIKDRCEQLREAFRSRGLGLEAEFPSPLSDPEISTLSSWFPVQLPEPVRELYRWHNGQPDNPCSEPLIYSFRGMIFTSLQRARVEYDQMMSTWGVETSRDKDGVDLRTSFPFATGSDGWYVFPCDGQDIDPRNPFPIVSVSLDFGVHYHSLEAMLATCIDWERASAWSPNTGWTLPEREEMEIWRAHNPGIFGVAV